MCSQFFVGMDVDLEQIPSQCGTGIVDIMDGKVLKLTGDINNEQGRLLCEKIHRMLLVKHFLIIASHMPLRIAESVQEMNKCNEFQYLFFRIDT